MTLTNDQVAELLRPLEGYRVQRDGKGYSHVEAWDIRKRMNQIFGFGGWDADTTDMQLMYENEREGGKPRYDVAYRARCEVRIHATGAMFAEWAAGDARNYPDRADAHDQAIKTAESQAFKRACVNLGDQFGLSLYKDGSLEATVGEIVGTPHADSEQVTGWEDTLKAVDSWDGLSAVAAQIGGADITHGERQRLREGYKQARARLEASLGPEPV